MADQLFSEFKVDTKPLSSLRVIDLKTELEKRGLPKSGSKKELLERLKRHLQLENLQQKASQNKDQVPNLSLQDDALVSQNEVVKEYLAGQQRIYELQKEARRKIEQDDANRGSDTEASSSQDESPSKRVEESHLTKQSLPYDLSPSKTQPKPEFLDKKEGQTEISDLPLVSSEQGIAKCQPTIVDIPREQSPVSDDSKTEGSDQDSQEGPSSPVQKSVSKIEKNILEKTSDELAMAVDSISFETDRPLDLSEPVHVPVVDATFPEKIGKSELDRATLEAREAVSIIEGETPILIEGSGGQDQIVSSSNEYKTSQIVQPVSSQDNPDVMKETAEACRRISEDYLQEGTNIDQSSPKADLQGTTEVSPDSGKEDKGEPEMGRIRRPPSKSEAEPLAAETLPHQKKYSFRGNRTSLGEKDLEESSQGGKNSKKSSKPVKRRSSSSSSSSRSPSPNPGWKPKLGRDRKGSLSNKEHSNDRKQDDVVKKEISGNLEGIKVPSPNNNDSANDLNIDLPTEPYKQERVSPSPVVKSNEDEAPKYVLPDNFKNTLSPVEPKKESVNNQSSTPQAIKKEKSPVPVEMHAPLSLPKVSEPLNEAVKQEVPSEVKIETPISPVLTGKVKSRSPSPVKQKDRSPARIKSKSRSSSPPKQVVRSPKRGRSRSPSPPKTSRRPRLKRDRKSRSRSPSPSKRRHRSSRKRKSRSASPSKRKDRSSKRKESSSKTPSPTRHRDKTHKRRGSKSKSRSPTKRKDKSPKRRKSRSRTPSQSKDKVLKSKKSSSISPTRSLKKEPAQIGIELKSVPTDLSKPDLSSDHSKIKSEIPSSLLKPIIESPKREKSRSRSSSPKEMLDESTDQDTSLPKQADPKLEISAQVTEKDSSSEKSDDEKLAKSSLNKDASDNGAETGDSPKDSSILDLHPGDMDIGSTPVRVGEDSGQEVDEKLHSEANSSSDHSRHQPRNLSNRKLSLSGSRDSKEETKPQRKRRWGSLTKTSKSTPGISTESLKDLIPDYKPNLSSLSALAEESHSALSISIGGEALGEDIYQSSPEKSTIERELSIKSEPVRVVQLERHRHSSTSSVPGGPSVSSISSSTPVPVKAEDSDPQAGAVLSGTQSPAKNAPSRILHIRNLVRPFTLPQLKEMLGRTGTLVADAFWIDKIKSKCYLMYDTLEQAVNTRVALHGSRWPVSNPKTLLVDFSTEEELNFHKQLGDNPGLPPVITNSAPGGIVVGQRGVTDPQRGDEHFLHSHRLAKNMTVVVSQDVTAPATSGRTSSSRQHREDNERSHSASDARPGRHLPVREWDRDKLSQEGHGSHGHHHHHHHHKEGGKAARAGADAPPEGQTAPGFSGSERDRKERTARREKKELNKRKVEEPPPGKLLDDLFKKTKAVPCIYWLPLTESALALREAEKKQWEVEREKRREKRQETGGREGSSSGERKPRPPKENLKPLPPPMLTGGNMAPLKGRDFAGGRSRSPIGRRR